MSDERGSYDRVATLPLRVDSHELEPRRLEVAGKDTRVSTVVRLRGGDDEGVGEDVTYEAKDHRVLRESGDDLPLAHRGTLGSFSGHLEDVDLFPTAPAWEPSRAYRRWAFESAALDLALRQAGVSLGDALDRAPGPVCFVVSLGLGDPPSTAPIDRLLERYPDLRFKVDPTPAWDADLVAALDATGRIDVVDFKGFYEITNEWEETASLYALVAEGLPSAWLEDPRIDPETRRVLEPHRDRITWDKPIVSVQSVESLPHRPRMLNFKPSRFGTVQRALDAYDHCVRRGIDLYGGGQFEIGPGRGQIQYLAALFHGDAPNDVAPVGFHRDPAPRGLATSPLSPRPATTGFRWARDDG